MAIYNQKEKILHVMFLQFPRIFPAHPVAVKTHHFLIAGLFILRRLDRLLLFQKTIHFWVSTDRLLFDTKIIYFYCGNPLLPQKRFQIRKRPYSLDLLERTVFAFQFSLKKADQKLKLSSFKITYLSMFKLWFW